GQRAVREYRRAKAAYGARAPRRGAVVQRTGTHRADDSDRCGVCPSAARSDRAERRSIALHSVVERPYGSSRAANDYRGGLVRILSEAGGEAWSAGDEFAIKHCKS